MADGTTNTDDIGAVLKRAPELGRVLLRADEVAAYLAMAEKSVYNRTYDGRIPSVRISASGGPRYEPLVVLSIREGATIEQTHLVAAALSRRAPEAEVLAIWRNASPPAPRRRQPRSARRGGQ